MFLRHVIPVFALQPDTFEWTIKCRVESKDTIRFFQTGKVCTLILVDEYGTEINAVMFNDILDTFYEKLMLDEVYYISNGTIQRTKEKGKYSHVSNVYQIIFNNKTKIVKEENKSIHYYKPQFETTEIAKLETLPQNFFVDVMGKVLDASEFVENDKDASKQRKTITLTNGTANVQITF